MIEKVIEVEHVSKLYEFRAHLEIKKIFQWHQVLKKQQAEMQRTQQRYVLSDVNFALEKGQTLGLIGHNGAGKTTLLRLLAKVTLPTQGRVFIKGRISSLINIGVGFHPELTGRENVYLNFALMGFNREHTESRLDDILEFADLGDYIDVPFKRYSSGMMARLGFSAAIHVEPEIILLDEVLGVGDYSFMVKSLAAIQDFVQRGTLVFVSHDLASVERICERVIWLDHGKLMADGPGKEVIREYIHSQQRKILMKNVETTEGDSANSVLPAEVADEPSGLTPLSMQQKDEQLHHVQHQAFDPTVTVASVGVYNLQGEPCTEFSSPDTIVVRCDLRITHPLKDLRIVFGLVDIQTRVVITAADNQLVDTPQKYLGYTRVECVFPDIALRPRDYGLYIGLSNPKALLPLYIWKDIQPRFFVQSKTPNPTMHFYAPQEDLVYTSGVSMSYLDVNVPLTD